MRPDRRQFVRTGGLALAAGLGGVTHASADEPGPRSSPPRRAAPASKKLAVVTTTYHYLSHAYHIAGRFLNGYLRGGEYHFPDAGIASAYVEQVKAADLSRDLAKRHGFRVADSIADALTLGTGKLAVDGVLLIAEHGDYPYNAKGQKLYPRAEYFAEVVKVFEASGRSVPVFVDKHLSYDFAKAKGMVDAARRLGFPMLAGSSLPVTWRRPELELPLGVKLQEALVVSRGELEIYGIHALEALQCMVERPTTGQQGVKWVECLEGDAVWKAGDDGRWSWELLEHALGRSPSRNVGDVRENCRHFRPPSGWGVRAGGPRAFLFEYRDGLKAAILQLDGHVADETFAARVGGEKKPVSTLFWLPPPPGAAFLEALAIHVERFVAGGKPPYPVERTLLTGGILDAALESRFRKGARVETPQLDVRYDPPADSGFMRGDYTNPVN
jgi:hypothetical protein